MALISIPHMPFPVLEGPGGEVDPGLLPPQGSSPWSIPERATPMEPPRGHR